MQERVLIYRGEEIIRFPIALVRVDAVHFIVESRANVTVFWKIMDYQIKGNNENYYLESNTTVIVGK